MAKEDPKPVPPTQDEDLLANAISIEGLEEETAAPAGAPAAAPGPVALEPIDLAGGGDSSGREIRSLATQRRHEAKWHRTPNATGQGAIHVKTFVSKLRLDAIENLDQQVNEWLDSHPQYEVKFVTSSIGPLTGKITEPAIFVNVWV
jgi:hypothetical protein